MNVIDALNHRRTTRGFKPDPVPSAVLQRIFEGAQLSASNCNTQPWQVVVVSGEARERLAAALISEVTSGKAPAPAFQPGDANLDGQYRERQIACAVEYYKVMGIAREDKAARNALMLKNWGFFDAPHVAFLSMPKSMGAVNAIDVGIYLQSLMLLFVENDIASCPQGALAFFPDPVHELAGIPDDHGILCGISFGYADPDAKINEVRMPRAPMTRSVSFLS